MSKTYFFYDLETSGFSPRRDRIMQFAGIRTDENFREIPGEEYNLLIYLAEDILPSPTAVMVTKITPQKTHEEGYLEADFAKIFDEKINLSDTVFVGYNNIRFDDEFMRNFLWRNFRDAYEWQWKNRNSRWDLLDAVRMIRALRPDGISWPTMKITDEKGEIREIPANKLELLSVQNNFPHRHAHDALSDVEDTINLARLLREKQPKIFDFLLENRGKNEVAKIVNSGQPFVYASGKFPSENEKTSIVVNVGASRNSSILVYDLREDPEDFAKMTEDEMLENLTASWEERKNPNFQNLPIKELAFNKCPAVAPLGTLDLASQKRINLDLETIEKNFAKLQKNRGIIDKMAIAFSRRNEAFREKQIETFAKKSEKSDEKSMQNSHTNDVEDQLYDSFTPPEDKGKIASVRNAEAGELVDFQPDFHDERLTKLLLRFKARNFAKSLSENEKKKYETWRAKKLQNELPKYLREIDFLEFFAKNPDEEAQEDFAKNLSENEQKEFANVKNFVENFAKLGNKIDGSVLVDLRLWAESIAPYDDAGDGDFRE
jgi:exodeoxyribonuclease-1